MMLAQMRFLGGAFVAHPLALLQGDIRLRAAFLVFYALRKAVGMYVRLKKKLANVMDGVDVSHARQGDVLTVSDEQGKSLIAEGWAEVVTSEHHGLGSASVPSTSTIGRPSRRSSD